MILSFKTVLSANNNSESESMAGQDVSFDPSLLTQEESQSLLDKIEINSNAPSNNACKNWSKNI